MEGTTMGPILPSNMYMCLSTTPPTCIRELEVKLHTFLALDLGESAPRKGPQISIEQEVR
jgi:hypothetical protein